MPSLRHHGSELLDGLQLTLRHCIRLWSGTQEQQLVSVVLSSLQAISDVAWENDQNHLFICPIQRFSSTDSGHLCLRFGKNRHECLGNEFPRSTDSGHLYLRFGKNRHEWLGNELPRSTAGPTVICFRPHAAQLSTDEVSGICAKSCSALPSLCPTDASCHILWQKSGTCLECCLARDGRRILSAS